MATKPYKFEDLTNLLDEDFAWRRKELQIIKEQIPLDYSPKQKAALRFSVPILYAHWEGFVKKSCELYLKHVSYKQLKNNQLQPQFIALSLSNKIGDIDINHIKEKTKAVSFLIDRLNHKSNIKTKNIIQTKSNLKYSVFAEILFVVGIEESKFSSKKDLIDELVDARNNIAHGDYLRVEYEAYHSMHNEIEGLMEHLKNEIENAAIQESYRAL